MVMHARKPQRLNDGYFEKHQAHPYQSSKYSSKRDYEREASSRSTNYLRGSERDLSPNSCVPGGTLNNGSNSYRSDSPDLDSPRDSRDRDRDRYQSSSYIQKMKDRGRSDYKKDKYAMDKRDRRERDAEHRTNHDRIDLSSRRSSKLCNLSSDKRSGSDDRERSDRDRSDRDIRDRDRERDRDRDRDRDRLSRMGDWSEHVSSSGKKYYYNCKTEVSQWEKPKEWLDKERNISKEQHRDYRDKERDRDREDRFSRSSYVKHSSSRSSRLRWPHDSDGIQVHRRRNEVDSQDMDISPGDSTPTSETSYSHSSTPTTQPQGSDGPILLANALPRLSSHPSTPTNSQLHFTTPSLASGINTSSTCTVSFSSGNGNSSSVLHSSSSSSSSSSLVKLSKSADNSMHHTTLPTSPPLAMMTGNNNVGHNAVSSISSTVVPQTPTSGNELIMNSNAPGPPTPVTLANLPKILSQITGNKQIDQTELNPQKALQTINNALLMSSRQQQQHSITSVGYSPSTQPTAPISPIDGSYLAHSNSLREHALNSPLYNLPHNMQQHSMLNHTSISGSVAGSSGSGTSSQYVQSSATGMISTQAASMGIGISSQFSAAGVKADGSSTLLVGDGPPTPTQELDMSGDHRKSIDGTSASLSSLQILRSQGPSLTPSLANYFRADLIAHVTNWPAEILEKQAQIASDEAIVVGDLQCTKVSADLKSARSVVRITEITATLQEQKVMYLRQQIQRLEELKSQNSFMSEDL